jgi:hypothetical protein
VQLQFFLHEPTARSTLYIDNVVLE